MTFLVTLAGEYETVVPYERLLRAQFALQKLTYSQYWDQYRQMSHQYRCVRLEQDTSVYCQLLMKEECQTVIDCLQAEGFRVLLSHQIWQSPFHSIAVYGQGQCGESS
jgi:hypothetical protein